MRIATWNVNSVRQRLGHLLDFLKEAEPDALCLQEIKCLDADFPRAEIASVDREVEAIPEWDDLQKMLLEHRANE